MKIHSFFTYTAIFLFLSMIFFCRGSIFQPPNVEIMQEMSQQADMPSENSSSCCTKQEAILSHSTHTMTLTRALGYIGVAVVMALWWLRTRSTYSFDSTQQYMKILRLRYGSMLHFFSLLSYFRKGILHPKLH